MQSPRSQLPSKCSRSTAGPFGYGSAFQSVPSALKLDGQVGRLRAVAFALTRLSTVTVKSDIGHIFTKQRVLLEHSISCIQVSTKEKYGSLMFADLSSIVDTLLSNRAKVQGR